MTEAKKFQLEVHLFTASLNLTECNSIAWEQCACMFHSAPKKEEDNIFHIQIIIFLLAVAYQMLLFSQYLKHKL